MALKEALILGAAKQLLNLWNERNVNDRPAGESDIAKGIKSMILNRFVNQDILEALPEALRPTFLMDAIKLFQERAGILQDGILGRITRNRLTTLFGCNQPAGVTPPQLTGDIASTTGKPARIVCHIASDFPRQMQGTDTEELLANAIDSWLVHINLSVGFTNDLRKANVSIKWGPLDGDAGSKLAEAHVGGPRALASQQLTLLFDDEEDFENDKLKFQGTTAHEFGHILGLDHVPVRGQLLSAFFDRSIIVPQANDIARMQAIWGRA